MMKAHEKCQNCVEQFDQVESSMLTWPWSFYFDLRFPLEPYLAQSGGAGDVNASLSLLKRQTALHSLIANVWNDGCSDQIPQRNGLPHSPLFCSRVAWWTKTRDCQLDGNLFQGLVEWKWMEGPCTLAWKIQLGRPMSLSGCTRYHPYVYHYIYINDIYI